jgi:hypothetical protein
MSLETGSGAGLHRQQLGEHREDESRVLFDDKNKVLASLQLNLHISGRWSVLNQQKSLAGMVRDKR